MPANRGFTRVTGVPGPRYPSPSRNKLARKSLFAPAETISTAEYLPVSLADRFRRVETGRTVVAGEPPILIDFETIDGFKRG